MKIPVLGMDPSLTNWGLAEGLLDLTTGVLDTPHLTLVETSPGGGKQVRQNSDDLRRVEVIAATVLPAAKRAKVVFAEIPVGSQSSRAQTSYGVCLGVLGVLRAMGIPIIEVNPAENKLVFTGLKDATKAEMIRIAVANYPAANFPRHNGVIANKAEHVADAIAAIHAGVRTPVFQQIMRLYQQVDPTT